MTAKTTTCVALDCNTCGEFLDPFDNGTEAHYDDLAQAVDIARQCGWIAHPDGFAICDYDDAKHAAAIAELMPPEFDPVCEGQAEIPFTTAVVVVITAPREFDVYTAPELREAIVEAVRTGTYRIVVDLSGTDFIDPTGMGVLVGQSRRTTTHGGWLRLVGVHGQVLSGLRLTGLHKVFVLADTVEGAINHETEGATTP